MALSVKRIKASNGERHALLVDEGDYRSCAARRAVGSLSGWAGALALSRLKTHFP